MSVLQQRRIVSPRARMVDAPRRTPGVVARYATVRRVGGASALILLTILFWMIFYQNTPNNLNGMADTGPVTTSDEGARIAKVLMILVSAGYIAAQFSQVRALTKTFNPGFVGLLVLTPLSAMWSIDSNATLLRCVSLDTIVLICIAIASTGWNPRRFQQVALPPLMLILLGSLVVGIVAPDRITEIGGDVSQRDAWHGITHSKNEFGMMSSIATIICVNRVLSREGRLYWAIASALVGATCLILSRSNTSELATLVGVASMVLVMRVPIIQRRFSSHVVYGIGGVVLLYELVIQNVLPGTHTLLAPITALMGKDTTFSSRTIIWDVIKEHIQWAPYLGTGYGAYWTGPFPSSPSYVFVPLMYFYPTEAHNGYLDIVNDMGLLGLAVLLVFLFWFLRQTLQLMRIDRNQAALYAALLFQQMVMNMSESEWLARTSTFSVMILAIFCLSRALVEIRGRA